MHKEFAPAIFLDATCTFDKVWHQGLLHKLREHIPPCFCRLISSYLHNRTFRVAVGSESSATHSILAGVPQSSILSPTLFSLYTHTRDMPIIDGTIVASFSDDSSVIAHNVHYDKVAQQSIDFLDR